MKDKVKCFLKIFLKTVACFNFTYFYSRFKKKQISNLINYVL